MSFQQRILDFARRHEIIDDPRVQELMKKAYVDYSWTRKQVAIEMRRIAEENHEYPFKSMTPNVSLTDNAVLLGKELKTGAPVALKEEELVHHLGVFGRTGAGKTTLFQNLMTHLTVPFWAFDRKQDYRHMVQVLPDLLVLPWSQLKFNPLKPPDGVDPSRWAQVFTEIFSHATSLLSGSKNHLLTAVMELYTEYGLFQENTGPYPSLFELYHHLDQEAINYVRKKANYRDTVVNRLEPMIMVLGHIFDCSQGYSIEELMQRRVVFEVGGLNRDIQRFLQEILFAYAYEHQLAENKRSGELELVIFVDEGKQMFSVYLERQDASGIPEIDDLTARARQFGLGLAVADQEATKLTESIMANTRTKIMLPAADHNQFESVAESIGLSEMQRGYARSLAVGEGVLDTGSGEPVVTDLYNYQLERTMSKQEIREDQEEKWRELTSTHRREPEFLPTETGQEKDDSGTESEKTLSEEAEILLVDVVKNPTRKITDRYSEFSSRYKGNKAKTELVEKGFVTERKVRKKFGQPTLLELTEKGRDYVDKYLDVDLKQRGRGGVVHRYWQETIADSFREKGWEVELEKNHADVAAESENRRIAVEVALESSNREIGHIEDRFDAGFDEVWIGCEKKPVCNRLKERLEENGFDGDIVHVRLLQEMQTPPPPG